MNCDGLERCPVLPVYNTLPPCTASSLFTLLSLDISQNIYRVFFHSRFARRICIFQAKSILEK